MSVALVFETHSTTIDNEAGIATGWLGGTRSARGRELAGELGMRRRDDGVDVVVTSDLARAVETAKIAFGEDSIPVVLDWRLREVDYGAWTGAAVTVIERQRSSRVDVPFPGGESYRDAAARMRSLLRDVRAAWMGKRVLVIGHSATRWSLDHLLDGKPLERLVAAPFDWREGWEYVVEPRSLALGTAP